MVAALNLPELTRHPRAERQFLHGSNVALGPTHVVSSKAPKCVAVRESGTQLSDSRWLQIGPQLEVQPKMVQ